MIAIPRAKALVIIAAALIFAEVEHFRAESHRLKVRAVSVCFNFVGIGRVNIRDIGGVVKAVSPNCQLAITVIRGRQLLLIGEFVIEAKLSIFPARNGTIGIHSALGIAWIRLRGNPAIREFGLIGSRFIGARLG